jgi:hypothetical protein
MGTQRATTCQEFSQRAEVSLGGEMDAQGLNAPQVDTAPIETGEAENRSAGAREVEQREIEAAEAGWEQEREPAAAKTELSGSEAAEAHAREKAIAEQEAQDAEAHTAGRRERGAYAQEEQGVAARVNESSFEEDETQLAAIRELMTRASARGIWLSLGEIAQATEFAEASISAQLRHLRKAHHGGHCVEKRRRGSARAVARRKIRDARRGPVIWEYRVLPRA